MLRFTEDHLHEILNGGLREKIIVLGDLMLDRYLWGNVSRISPEAPVPIINIEDEEIRLGGAGNVANNLIGLGALPLMAGVVGDDEWGDKFRSMLSEKHLSHDGVITDGQRPTTMKTRIIGNNQHIARVDREKLHPVDRQIQTKILDFIRENIAEVEAILIQDYNKGVLATELIHQVIQLARERDKIITVDPKFKNFWEFKGVTVFKPNKKEVEEALARHIETPEDFLDAGDGLLKRLNAHSILITRGKEGMALFDRDTQPTFLETRARKVADVSGAGDTVIATLTFALAAKSSLQEAVTLANYAAGLVCEEVGVVPVEGQKLVKSILKNQEFFDEK